MMIGILSDTHGNVVRTATAAALLKTHGAQMVFHCGDIGSEQVLIELAGQFGAVGTPVHAVLGNVDQWDTQIMGYPSDAGVEVHGARYETHLDGKRLVVIHGHETRRLDAAIADGSFDYVLTGHTHQREDRHAGPTRIVNPGAVHRTLDPTVAMLDTRTNTLRFIALRDGAFA